MTQAPLTRCSPAVAVLACAMITLGLVWDISWHATIGRDSFWTPAHILIYVGGILAGAVAASLGWQATFGRSARREDTVTVCGARAPFGAWLIAWGGATMLSAAPFDSWWHDAYGLDVGILTPAHSVLALGMLVVHAGALVLVVAASNRRETRRAISLVTLATALLLLLVATLLMEYNYPNQQHGTMFYLTGAIAYPVVLVAGARAEHGRWSATRAAALYMALTLAMLWALPLFSGEPRLAPIFNPVHHMWPGIFPLLLVVPAATIDVLSPMSAARPLVRAATLGGAFLLSFLAVQWPFSAFLLTPAARNAFFAADQWYFMVTHTQQGRDLLRLGEWRYTFWTAGDAPQASLFFIVGFVAMASSAAGLWWGGTLRRVQR